MEFRQAVVWAGLLLASQATDTATTAIDSARGALESMPLSSRLLMQGGIGLFGTTKVLLTAAVFVALLLTARWVRLERPGARIVFRLVLVSVQLATIGLVWVSATNTLLFGSLVQ
jgi:hypothetical protein